MFFDAICKQINNGRDQGIKMNKPYKISYKTYFNDRLKEVLFHDKLTHPLYVQVTYNRQSIFFKSYYFELLSKSKYLLVVHRVGTKAPEIKEVIEKEQQVIDYIVERKQEDFSLELFKQEYAYYSKDICDLLETAFIDYLYVFFQDKGMPALAATIRQGVSSQTPYELIRDLKRAFTKPLYEELIENSFSYAPPYIGLYGFMQQWKDPNRPSVTKTLTVMEWEREETKAAFLKYMSSHHKNIPAKEAVSAVAYWLDRHRKESAEG